MFKQRLKAPAALLLGGVLLSGCAGAPVGPNGLQPICSLASPTAVIYQDKATGYYCRASLWGETSSTYKGAYVVCSSSGNDVKFYGRYGIDAMWFEKELHIDRTETGEFTRAPDPMEMRQEVRKVGETALKDVYLGGRLPGGACMPNSFSVFNVD